MPSICTASMSFMDVVGHCLQTLLSPSLEIMFYTAWGLWKARNVLIWEQKVMGVDDICQLAAGSAIDFLESVLPVQNGGGYSEVEAASRWRPPDINDLKINVAFKRIAGSSSVGIGVLIRDSLGSVNAVMVKQSALGDDYISIYAQVALSAIKFAFDVGLPRIDMDIGCKELLAFLLSEDICLASVGITVDDILFMKRYFLSVKFSFVSSNCNKAAIALATEAVSSPLEQVWLNDYPVCITSHVQFDSI